MTLRSFSIVAISCTLYVLCVPLQAQQMKGLGAYAGIQYGQYPSNLVGLPNNPTCCTNFGNGSSFDVYGGLLYRVVLGADLALDLRIGASTNAASFSREEEIGNAPTGEGDNERVVRAISRYDLSTSRIIAEVAPMLNWHVGSGFNAMIGPYLGYVLSGSFTTNEVLVQPTSATFSDTRSLTRNQRSGVLEPIVSLQAGIVTGLAYDIDVEPLGATLSPEVMFILPFTTPVELPNNQNWSQMLFRAGLAIRFKDKPLAEPVGTVIPPLESPSVAISARELRNGEYRDVARIVVTETLSREMYPLLPYIFFEEGQHLLPVRYRRISEAQARRYDPSTQYKYDSTSDKRQNTMKVYHDILNVIGKRLSTTPGSFVTLTGFRSGESGETADARLSSKRAQSVREYLINAWNLDTSQVRLGTHGALPPKAAKTNMSDNMDVRDGHAENRRVEISANPPSLLFPVIVEDTARTIDKPNVEYVLQSSASIPIMNWTLIAREGVESGSSVRLVDTTGYGSVPPVVVKKYDGAVDQRSIPKQPGVLRYDLNVRDVESRTGTASNSMDVEYVTLQQRRRRGDANVEVNTYRLIMFDYETSELQGVPKSILEEFSIYDQTVLEDAANSDTTLVRGYTDRKGNESANRVLATQRATTVADRIRTSAGSKSIVVADGAGEEDAPYPNTLPEQRLYNRTVEIVTKRGGR
jgi:outer membrane protein OmpA-like peptidoglycan-associated protein